MTAAAGRPEVLSTRYLGAAPRHRTDAWAMIGQDGGQSIPLGDRVLFVFSDTLLLAISAAHPHTTLPPGFSRALGEQGVFLANCAALGAREPDLRLALAGQRYYLDREGFPRELLAASPAERAAGMRFWPEHGVASGAGVYLYYLGIQTVDPTSIWGFRNLGTGLAVLDPETGTAERLASGGGWCFWPAAPVGDDLHFGVQVVREGDDLYVFNSLRRGLTSQVRLARVAAARIADLEAYEYLSSTAPRWSARYEDSCDLGTASTEFSVSYNPHLGAYLLVYLDGYSKELRLRTAARIWGPYTPCSRVTGVPHSAASEMVYLGFEHPCFRQDEGSRIFVSYCEPRFRRNSLLSVRFR